MFRLSERMQLIADMISYGASVADIGTDHGFIPIYLRLTDKASKVILTDIAKGPLAKAKENMDKYGISEGESFSLRLGAGLEPLSKGEADTVIIAGMGGELISSILEHDISKAKSFDYLILQPRTMCEKLRMWLEMNGFKVIEEHLVEEGPQMAQLMMAVPAEKLEGRSCQIYSSQMDYEIAPLLFESKDKNLKQFLSRSLTHARLVSFNLKAAKPDLSENKLTEWNRRINWLEGKLTKL